MNQINPDCDMIIRKAFEKTVDNNEIVETGIKKPYSDKYAINLSNILTKLIQDTGRLCDRFASDLIIDWDIIRDAINDDSKNHVFAIGIRANGVDGNGYIVSHMFNDWSPHYYRRIYGVAVTHGYNEFGSTVVTVTLRNIQSEVDMLEYYMRCSRRFGRQID